MLDQALTPKKAPVIIPTRMSKYGDNYKAALRMQKRLFELVMLGGTDVMILPQLVRAWDVLEERKRTLRFIPKVQAISVRELQALKAQRQTKQLKAASLFEEPNKKESLSQLDPSGHPPGEGESPPSSSGVGTPPAIDIPVSVDSQSGGGGGVSASPKYAKPWKWKSKAASSVAGDCCQPTSESGHVTDLASSVDQVSSAEELLAELKAAGMNLEEPVPEVDGEQPQE